MTPRRVTNAPVPTRVSHGRVHWNNEVFTSGWRQVAGGTQANASLHKEPAERNPNGSGKRTIAEVNLVNLGKAHPGKYHQKPQNNQAADYNPTPTPRQTEKPHEIKLASQLSYAFMF